MALDGHLVDSLAELNRPDLSDEFTSIKRLFAQDSIKLSAPFLDAAAENAIELVMSGAHISSDIYTLFSSYGDTLYNIAKELSKRAPAISFFKDLEIHGVHLKNKNFDELNAALQTIAKFSMDEITETSYTLVATEHIASWLGNFLMSDWWTELPQLDQSFIVASLKQLGIGMEHPGDHP